MVGGDVRNAYGHIAALNAVVVCGFGYTRTIPRTCMMR